MKDLGIPLSLVTCVSFWLTLTISLTDKMKDAIVAKVATQAADYYQDAYRLAASPMVKNMWDKVTTSGQIGSIPVGLTSDSELTHLTVYLCKARDLNTNT